MVQTVTVIKCEGEGCEATLVGCLGDSTNRESNAVSYARREGWARTHGDKGQLKDLCQECRRAAG